MTTFPHQPILVNPILEGLHVADRANARYIDGTVGAGGHTAAILHTREDNRVVGFDRDADALAIAGERLTAFGERVQLIHASYVEMATLDHYGQIDGIVLDFGVSSMQLDQAKRGFAFRLDGPLDMRFDPTADGPTAAELINHLPEKELADLIYRYGEEKDSRRIARHIIEHRPFHSTRQLADLIHGNQRGPRQKIHPATRTFQALRIAVNDELQAVETVLPIALGALKSGGRLAVLTFHSLEDRIVKQHFKQEATDCLCPSSQPICTCVHQASIRLVNRKPLEANPTEIEHNPRARSAKLRIVEKR